MKRIFKVAFIVAILQLHESSALGTPGGRAAETTLN
jgi:hypothetical protein